MSDPYPTIDKPTLLLNEAAARRNLQRMAEKARRLNVRFRPHFKTHQSAEIGEWFRTEGVTAITTSSIDMAQYFARHGWNDITIAFPANLRQAPTLADLARQVHLGLLVESVETVEGLARNIAAPVDIWMKVDVGAHRTGLAWDAADAAQQVAEAVLRAPNFRLRGLLTHAGHTYGARGREAVCQRSAESAEHIDSLRCKLETALKARGVDRLEISVGDTPATSLCDDLGPVDEIRPGNFIFYDSQQVQIGSCGWEEVAVALACPVVARHPERSEIVVYGGAVHLSKDYLMDGDQRSYGAVCLPTPNGWSLPLRGAFVSGLSQEHGILRVPASDFDRIHIGDLVCILPAHSCLTVTLMKRYQTLDGRVIETMNV